jgi:uncharacterized protein (TIGR03435 family)
MSSAGTLALPLFLACAAFAQTKASLEFEVASIRPVSIQPDGRVNVGLHIDGSQARISAMSLKEMLAIAYRLRISQVTGPDWVSGQRFEVAATIPEGGQGHVLEMLQALLTDRFEIRMYREKRDFSVYALLVGKGPLKLKETPDEDDPDAKGTVNAAGGRRGGKSRSRRFLVVRPEPFRSEETHDGAVRTEPRAFCRPNHCGYDRSQRPL